MGAAQLILEHKYKNRFLRSVKVTSRRKSFTFGSSMEADLRLVGSDVSPFHAVLEFRESHWVIFDFGSATGTWVNGNSIIERSVESGLQLRIGQHCILLNLQNPLRDLFVETREFDRKSDLNLKASPEFHQVIFKHGSKVIESLLLPKTDSYRAVLDGVERKLSPPSGPNWTSTDFGPYQVQQRLVSRQVEIDREDIKVSEDLKLPLIVSVGIGVFLIILSLTLPRGSSSPDYVQPIDRNLSDLIFSAKVVREKRAEAQKVFSRPQTQAVSKDSEVKGSSSGMANKSGKSGRVSHAITQIRASGLEQLIGKIAKRSVKTVEMIRVSGTSPDLSDSHRVASGQVGSLASNSVEKVAEGNRGAVGSYRMNGIATGGKSGGASGYKNGTGLSVGAVGKKVGAVGIVSEESIVEGGLDRDVIAEVIKRDIGQIRYCYERQLSAYPELFGKVTIKFEINAQGLVEGPKIGSTTLNNAMAEGCILRRAARWKFPLPKGGTSVLVSYPFLFKTTD